MADEWWRHLKGKPFYWVLDGEHPAAVYFTLSHVVERPKEARGRKAARLALLESPQVAALKARLAPVGEALWTPRYATTLWVLRLLAELGVPGDDEGIAEALDSVLNYDGEGDLEPAPVNLNGILVHIAMALGFHRDERVQMRLQRMHRDLRDHQLPPTPTALADWLTLAAMALAEQPAYDRDPETLDLLKGHLQALIPTVVSRYEGYGFPTFDQPDDLVLAQAALRLGIGGDWLRPWVVRIEGRQDAEGLWRLDRALPTPGGVGWEQRGEPSRWLSAKAMYALRAFYGG